MKQGWEYKKIGNICNITTGKLDANAANEDGLYPFFTCSRIPLSINTYAYDCECILIAGNGDLNVKYYNGKFNAYQRTYILQLKNDVNGVEMRYIFAFFNLYIEELRRKSIGGIIKYIKLGDLTNALLPLPDITTQLSIVSELDKINELIRLKKEQLKDYDNLAQSIFYEMFGDPVENEKGWNKMKWKDVLTIINGKNQSAVVDENGDYPIYGSGGIMGYANNWLCPEKCTIIGRKGNINKPIFVESKFWNVDTAFGLKPNIEILSPRFLFYFCLNYNFERHNKAVTIPSLTKADLLKIDIPLPPLSLQRLFAQRIEQIEREKSEVQKSIQDLETLLASRMQYWFE